MTNPRTLAHAFRKQGMMNTYAALMRVAKLMEEK